jgi:ABC-2 type transport system ATP-binding protein
VPVGAGREPGKSIAGTDRTWHDAAVTVVLEASGLVKNYRRARAVDGVTLQVRAGERVALLGPNGAGKTTTLLMLLGVVTPDEGSVRICGRAVAGDRSHAAEEVGFAAGYLPLAERLRVREYLRLYGNLYGLRDPEPAIREGLVRFRVEHLADAMGTELSSGQRTLVGFVRATLHRPRLLVLDEPTASLDPDVARRVRDGLRQICDEFGTALLVTSHDMAEVQRLCPRVVFISGGRIVADGTPEAVAERFGRTDLEGVFLHLADDGPAPSGGQQTDHLA